MNTSKLIKNKRSCLIMELSQFKKEKWIVHPVKVVVNNG